ARSEASPRPTGLHPSAPGWPPGARRWATPPGDGLPPAAATARKATGKPLRLPAGGTPPGLAGARPDTRPPRRKTEGPPARRAGEREKEGPYRGGSCAPSPRPAAGASRRDPAPRGGPP